MTDQPEPRKATDIVLELSDKIDTLTTIIKTQELNIRVLSNKLNTLMEKLDKQPPVSLSPSFAYRAEAVNTKPAVAAGAAAFNTPPAEDKQMPVFAEFKVPIEEGSADGFRRTSRPESYQGDKFYQPKKDTPMESIKFPTQIPNMPQSQQVMKPPPGRGGNEIVVTPKMAANTAPPPVPSAPQIPQAPQLPQNLNAVPVQQRIISKENKAVFLADVEILDHSNNQQVYKGRTSGNGKWAASLVPGNYRVTVSKRESLTKQKVEVTQDIVVDGSKSPLELPTLTMK